MPITAVLT